MFRAAAAIIIGVLVIAAILTFQRSKEAGLRATLAEGSSAFTRAAATLNVRQPAISHQIRELEQFLGKRLFERQGARISPTAEADEFYLAASSGLSEIARGAERVRHKLDRQALSVATYPGIAAFWLLPRLASDSGSDDAPQLRVTTADRDADLPLGDADCAILFGEADAAAAVAGPPPGSVEQAYRSPLEQ